MLDYLRSKWGKCILAVEIIEQHSAVKSNQRRLNWTEDHSPIFTEIPGPLSFCTVLMSPSSVNKARSTNVLVLQLCNASALWAKTSNQAVWGDTGRVPLPLNLTLVKQVFEYFSRVTNVISSDSINHNAVKEQQALNLPWYTKFLELWNREGVHDETAIPNSKNRHSQAIQEKILSRFIETWNT